MYRILMVLVIFFTLGLADELAKNNAADPSVEKENIHQQFDDL